MMMKKNLLLNAINEARWKMHEVRSPKLPSRAHERTEHWYVCTGLGRGVADQEPLPTPSGPCIIVAIMRAGYSRKSPCPGVATHTRTHKHNKPSSLEVES